MAIKSFRDRNKTVVGVVSLAVLGAVLLVTFLVGNLGLLEGGYTMSAILPDSAGLRSGNDVRVAGVPVGKVTDVRADYGKGHVVVTWKVDDGIRLGPQTRAEITLSNLLGGRYVKLTGPVTRPYMDELPEERRLIPMERTSTPTLITDALKDATRLLDRLDTDSVDKLLSELAELEPAPQGRVSKLLDNIGELSEIISESEPELQKLLDNGNKIMEVLESKDEQLGRLIDSIEIMLDELRLRRDELKSFLGEGSDLVNSISDLVSRHEKNLIKIMDDVTAISNRLDSTSGKNLNSVLAWVGPTFSGLATTGGRNPWVDAIAVGLGPINPEVLGAIRKDRSDR
ncbi:MlaD family protein [Planomonospora venezuelensis]|uniref:Phospholipid/cholesterol/gamma-HCH transport system substrate-binding protein n=1 Tax=Planomonospora venezuelensis TaxID=1999 RepID=A0A841DBG0_PLAVE|nr:MlaD family protein [Planomonospora venezuelensis]MBB5964696.1 phospholipid/cholesterol/gamma-HCH transport system substrate-binding protein [Planomonospora venezuelensis]GIN03103.1 ABC transporter substrate-binding protein [Planomonospora venezuelensis]